MKAYVNPMMGWGNSPYLIIESKAPDLSNKLYSVTETCYWYQDPETGVTDFLFHTQLSEWKLIVPGHYRTPSSEGFGGRTFTLNLKEGKIDLVGPWSGGAYCANQYLPEPCIEVTYRESRFSYISGYLTWRKLPLPPGWNVGSSQEPGKYWPELLYKGQSKKEWSEETLLQLQIEYKRNDLYLDQVPSSR